MVLTSVILNLTIFFLVDDMILHSSGTKFPLQKIYSPDICFHGPFTSSILNEYVHGSCVYACSKCILKHKLLPMITFCSLAYFTIHSK